MPLFLWSSTNFLRCPFWPPARRVSQQKPMLSSSSNECGYTLGSHIPLSQIRTTSYWVHFGQASVRCWIPSSLIPQPSTPKLMAKHRSSTRWSCTFSACTTWIIHAHGMKSSPMSRTITTGLSIAQLAISLSRWGWDSSHCPIVLAIPFAATQVYSTHVQVKANRANNFIECIHRIH